MATVRQARQACVAVPSLTRRRASTPLQNACRRHRQAPSVRPASRRSYPVSMSSYPALHTSYPASPSPHISSPPNLSSPPHYPIQPSTPPIQPSALAWQWGGTKRACSVVLVLLVGCVLPGGGASTSPTTSASLEGSSDFSSPGRGLSDSMAKVREREATAALGCLPKVLAAGCPKSQVLWV